MLSPNPESRHGGSYSNLKNNSWFESIDWVATLLTQDELYAKNERKVRPAFIPPKQMLPEEELVRLRDKNNGQSLQDHFQVRLQTSLELLSLTIGMIFLFVSSTSI